MTRLKKVVRDLTQRWGRTAIVLAGLMLSLFGAGSVAVAIAVLSHDLDANFRRTDPANVTFDIAGLTPGLMARLAAIPGVKAADRRPIVGARIEAAPGRWLPFPIAVIDDFTNIPVARIYGESGAWPPPEGTVLIERDGRPFFRPAAAGALHVRLRDDSEPKIDFAGYAFDPAQGPSRMELAIYGYVSTATAAAWSYHPDAVRALFITAPEDATLVAGEIERLAAAAGAEVQRFTVDGKARYGHQFQLDAILASLAVAAAMLVLIGVVLVAGLVGSLMAKEQRCIGVMRAIGGRTGQIAQDYLLGMGGLGLIAGLAMLAPSLIGGMALTRFVAGKLNFNVLSVSPPLWVGPALIAAGVAIPVLIAALRVRRAAAMPVIAALARGNVGDGALSAGARLGFLPALPRMAATAILRRPRDVVLPAVVLSIGLAFFATVLNVRSSMLVSIDAIAETRPYDLVIALREPYPTDKLTAWAGETPGIVRAEAWLSRSAALYADGRNVTNYVGARGVPDGSTMIAPVMLEGRWLSADKPDGVVINQALVKYAPDALKVGGHYELTMRGRKAEVEIVGVVKEFGAGAIYVRPALLEEVAGVAGEANLMFASTADRSPAGQRAAAAALDAHPLPDGWNLANIQTSGGLAASVAAHLDLVSAILLFVATLALLVGLLALASTIGVSVVQRFREIAVLKAIGGRALSIAFLVIYEALFVAVLGWALAMVFAPWLSRFVTGMFGTAIIGYPFDYRAHPFGAALTLGAGAVVALVAGAAPVRAALAVSVHKALRTE